MAKLNEPMKAAMNLLLQDLFINREINSLTVSYAKALRRRYKDIGATCPMWVKAITNGNLEARDALWVETVRIFCQDYISLRGNK